MLDALRTLTCPDPAGAFRRQSGRLALFRPKQVLDAYWTKHWQDQKRREKLLDRAHDRQLAEYEPLLRSYMNPDGLVLEAGCGLSQIVGALHTRGLHVRGVELDADVVAFVNEAYPDLDVVAGDVTALAIPDGAVQTYISLGVVEHFPEGPERALGEARRVLARDGYALISVPMLNHARARHLAQIDDTPAAADLAFYQYYFSVDEFVRLAREAGLAHVEWRGMFAETHLRFEHPIMSRVWQSRVGRSRLRPQLKKAMASPLSFVRRRYSHMAMFVFRPA
jgi:SAM-dependent methyltransferase